MGGVKAHYDGIVAFSQTDFTHDLKKFSVPTLVMHCERYEAPHFLPFDTSSNLSRNGRCARGHMRSENRRLCPARRWAPRWRGPCQRTACSWPIRFLAQPDSSRPADLPDFCASQFQFGLRQYEDSWGDADVAERFPTPAR